MTNRHPTLDLEPHRAEAVAARERAVETLHAILAALRDAEAEHGVPWHHTSEIAARLGISAQMVARTATKFPRTLASQVEAQHWENGRRRSYQTFVARRLALSAPQGI